LRFIGATEEHVMVKTEQTSNDRNSELVGDYLLRRLREVGLSHIFGVAGDFNLEFLEQLETLLASNGLVAATSLTPPTLQMAMLAPMG
jgi:hypothetical protein